MEIAKGWNSKWHFRKDVPSFTLQSSRKFFAWLQIEKIAFYTQATFIRTHIESVLPNEIASCPFTQHTASLSFIFIVSVYVSFAPSLPHQVYFHFKCYRLILDLLVPLHFIDRDLSPFVFSELSHTNRRQVGELRRCSWHSNDTVY